jgi:hypothetical protein
VSPLAQRGGSATVGTPRFLACPGGSLCAKRQRVYPYNYVFEYGISPVAQSGIGQGLADFSGLRDSGDHDSPSICDHLHAPESACVMVVMSIVAV